MCIIQGSQTKLYSELDSATLQTEVNKTTTHETKSEKSFFLFMCCSPSRFDVFRGLWKPGMCMRIEGGRKRHSVARM